VGLRGVKRVNYVRTPSERLFGVPLQVDAHARAPLAALCAALLVVATVWFLEEARLGAAQRAGLDAAARLRSIAPELARARALEAEIARLRALDRLVDDLAWSGARSASRLALLGNRLPREAWLTTIRVQGRDIALEGRGARLATVGNALATLQRLPGYASARLVTVRRDTLHADVVYAIALEAMR
jgi:Tfp pilus assembly protein PilN